MEKKILYFFFIVIVILSMYYFDYNSNNIQYMMKMGDDGRPIEVIYDEKTVSENFAFGIYNSQNLTDGMQRSQYLNPGSNFSGWLRITNAMYDSNQYMVFALVDYKQQRFFFNNQTDKLHLVNLSKFEDNLYYFQINNISEGFHDVAIILVLTPYEHSLNEDYRFSTDMGRMGDRRLNLFVGDVNDTNDTRIGYVECDVSCQSSYVLNGLLVNKEPCSPKAWLSDDVVAGDELDYFVNVGNDDEPLRTFALMAFLDYKQIPFNLNSDELTIFGKLRHGEKISYHANLTLPDEEGVHELMIVWILDPYEKMETSPGVRAKINTRVEPSIRIGLNVSLPMTAVS